MEDTNSREWISNPLFIKAVIIAFLAVILLLPARLIQEIINDREDSWNRAVEEVSSKWAYPQTVTGPIISVPCTLPQIGPNLQPIREFVQILPSELTISGNVTPEVRHRGIYDVMLYKADLHVNGTFEVPELDGVIPTGAQLQWSESSIAVGITDLRGINKAIEIRLGDRMLLAQPGVKQTGVMQSGVSAMTNLVSDTIGTFSFDLSLNGSQKLRFIPVGKTTEVDLHSTWSHPSFDGAFLPDTHTINPDGFEARWTVLDLNRNFPQAWMGNAFRLNQSEFGLELFTPVDAYQKNWRATRYAALFIILTFLIYFFAEARRGSRVHPVQYALIGAVLCIFYAVLLSLSEHLRFEAAYVIASGAVVMLLTVFTATTFGSWKQPLLVFCSLAMLYGFLYSLLQLNDYALLIGSIGLFIIVGAFLLLSGKINWYSRNRQQT